MKLTIITINYNDVKGLKKTFESVFKQTNKDFEYVVIDGGSTDGSVSLIQEYQDKINFWISENDQGVYNAYNKGLLHSTGEYVLYINSGDELYSEEVVSKVLPLLNNYEIIYGDILQEIDAVTRVVKKYPNILKQSDFMFESIPTPSTFIKRSVFDDTNFFDESYKIVSDWKFFMKAILIDKRSYLKINEVISVFYFGGVSTRAGNMEERNKVLNDLFPFLVDDYIQFKEYTYVYNSTRVTYLRDIEKNKIGRVILHVFLLIMHKLLKLTK